MTIYPCKRCGYKFVWLTLLRLHEETACDRKAAA
jgi:hypothetical protein